MFENIFALGLSVITRAVGLGSAEHSDLQEDVLNSHHFPPTPQSMFEGTYNPTSNTIQPSYKHFELYLFDISDPYEWISAFNLDKSSFQIKIRTSI